MPVMDSRREALSPETVRGHPRLEGLRLSPPTTPSTTTDLNVNVGAGVAVIPPKAQQNSAQADFDCGAAITDLESLPVTIVAYYLPSLDDILFAAVPGTSHTTPATADLSRASYASDAVIEAALPTEVPDDMYTVVGVEVFARSGTTITQHHDDIRRTYNLETATKETAGDDFAGYEGDPAGAGLDLIRSGTAVVLNTASTVAVAVGAAFDAAPAVAILGEADGAITVIHAVWNGSGTLTITTSAAVTADRTVFWIVDGR